MCNEVPSKARLVLLSAAVLIVLAGWLPLPDAILHYLENQFPAPATVAAEELQPYVGLIVLSGGVERAWFGSEEVMRDISAERMMVSMALMRKHTHLRLLFTGGDGERFSQGLPPERMVYERAARTTYENAVLSMSMRGIEKTAPWLLITSAWHMPRALATFRAAGWNVTPYPVDCRTCSRTLWTKYSLVQGMLHWQLIFHEAIGFAAYAVAGRLKLF